MQLGAAPTWISEAPIGLSGLPIQLSKVSIQEAKSLLSRQPGVGARSSTSRYPDLRRLFLSRVRYHIGRRSSASPGKGFVEEVAPEASYVGPAEASLSRQSVSGL
jgi:hypothetical protein